METTEVTAERVDRPRDRGVMRVLALAGVAYALLEIAGDLTIGPFPDGSPTPSKLVAYYATHHSQVRTGGLLMAWGAVCLGLFGARLFTEIRSRAGGIALGTVVVVGAAMAAVQAASSAATYALLGDISTDHDLAPAALQAWHLAGAEFQNGAGITVLLLGVAAAGILKQAIPAWLAWPALVLAVAQLTPFGFLASLLFLLWSVVAAVRLALFGGDAVIPAAASATG